MDIDLMKKITITFYDLKTVLMLFRAKPYTYIKVSFYTV